MIFVVFDGGRIHHIGRQQCVAYCRLPRVDFSRAEFSRRGQQPIDHHQCTEIGIDGKPGSHSQQHCTFCYRDAGAGYRRRENLGI